MKIQNQIKRTLTDTTNLSYLNELVANNSESSRAEVIRAVCHEFNFYDPRGQMQIAGCARALRSLEDAGHIQLPKANISNNIKPSLLRLNQPVPLPVNVPESVNHIEALELLLVETREQKQLWNELMIEEHPLGATIFVGRQLRYLISSSQGYLGAIGFASAALQLSDRDQWIGWDTQQRQNHLHAVVGMNRFLIRPGIHCHNLASKVLSMSLAVLVRDFDHQYGYKPLLVESFVDEAWSGTSYRAANWIKIGKTKGRGRQDRNNQYALSCKAIYVYPLDTDFRQKMGLSANAGLGPLSLAEGLDGEHWAAHEFGGASLGDARLSKRLVRIALAKGESPGRSFAGASNGDLAETKAYYRLIEQPEKSAVNMDNILMPHRQRTARRMMDQNTVLCIQDGSELNYTNLDQCEGLGTLKANQTSAKTKGMNLHSTFAVTTNGLPLGIVKAQCIAPTEKADDDKRKAGAIPIEEKKTVVWIEHHQDLVELSKTMPQTRLVDVCDREADFFEFFDRQRQNPSVELLVRASHNRNIDVDQKAFKLFTAASQSPELGRIQVPIPKESARPKKSKQKVRKARPKRLAECIVRAQHICLPAPEYFAGKEPVTIWVIHALENNPPPNTDPVEWFLLTTIPINSSSDAEQCLRWYTLRWRIEDWHRVLKSGCRIKDLANETAERLRRAIAINLVIAWRIMLMTLLGRETPELPAEVLFSDIELRTLKAYAKKKIKTTKLSG